MQDLPHCTTNETPLNPVGQPAKAAGSRRRRLWEIAPQLHCTVIGMCLPVENLRAVIEKALGQSLDAQDYEIHVGAVTECGHRNRVSEPLHFALEKRYGPFVESFRTAKTCEALALKWKQTVEQGDAPGALWAALTHPRCDAHFEEVVRRNMHMYAHHSASNMFADVKEISALGAENAVLARMLAKVQERTTRLNLDKADEIKQLAERTSELRVQGAAKDSEIQRLRRDLETLNEPDGRPALGHDARLKSEQKIQQLLARQGELEAKIRELKQALSDASQLRAATPAVVSAPSLLQQQGDAAELDLQEQTVLCVGGRTGSIASYRSVIEAVGGRFSHHDGGLEDGHRMLDASLAAADLVICQTGCISHNAYWRVKDFCKRTGKRCVFVENPSTSSLARGLEAIWLQPSAEPLEPTEPASKPPVRIH